MTHLRSCCLITNEFPITRGTGYQTAARARNISVPKSLHFEGNQDHHRPVSSPPPAYFCCVYAACAASHYRMYIPRKNPASMPIYTSTPPFPPLCMLRRTSVVVLLLLLPVFAACMLRRTIGCATAQTQRACTSTPPPALPRPLQYYLAY